MQKDLATPEDHHNRQEPWLGELRYQLLARHTTDLVYLLDESAAILEINQAADTYGYTPQELIGRSFGELVHPDDREQVVTACLDLLARRQDASVTRQYRLLTRTGQVRRLEDKCVVRFDQEDRFLLLLGVCSDIGTVQSKPEKPVAADGDLEDRMSKKIKELKDANQRLQDELHAHRQNADLMREREAEHEIEMATLLEANRALKVLFKRRDAHKHAFEDQVMLNVKQLLLPYLDKLKAGVLDERQEAYVTILESNLNEITSPFSRRLSIDYFNLTPAEFKVANFIRQGKRSRDIATLLGLSVRTVEAYRLSIRRKMRLQNKKINLRTFLQTIR